MAKPPVAKFPKPSRATLEGEILGVWHVIGEVIAGINLLQGEIEDYESYASPHLTRAAAHLRLAVTHLEDEKAEYIEFFKSCQKTLGAEWCESQGMCLDELITGK